MIIATEELAQTILSFQSFYPAYGLFQWTHKVEGHDDSSSFAK